MSAEPVVWLQLVGLLALEVALAIGIAALLQSSTRTPVWRRTIWQACVAGVVALTLLEATGATHGVVRWVNTNIRSERKPASPKPTALPDTKSDLSRTQTEVAPVHRLPPLKQAEIPAPPIEVGATAPLGARSTIILCAGLLWIAGCGIVLAHIVVSRCVFLIFCRKQQTVFDEGLLQRVKFLARALGISRRVRLLEATRLSGPIAFGILRPAIGLPRQFTSSFTAAQQEVMLAHELAHLAARDPAWYLLADMAAAFLWWHPLVWWARCQLHVASETAADEASVLIENGPGVLAECLVTLGARIDQRRAFGWLGVDGFRSGLGRRVERLFSLKGSLWHPPNALRSGLARILGPMALVAAVILCTAWAAPQALTKGEDMKTQIWKRSLAAVALTALLGNDHTALAADAASSPAKADKAPAKTDRAAAVASEQNKDNPIDSTAAPESKGVQAMRAKLEQIILPEVKYDGLPLEEVVKQLIVESAKRDPDKLGVNFLFSSPPPAPSAIDPATGLPISGTAESIDLRSITIRIMPPLKQVRFIDVLDAITKVADAPIRYAIEEYAVVISLDPSGGTPVTPTAQSPLTVMTVHVGTNNVFSNVEKVFGVRISSQSASKMQNDLRQFLVRLGINMDVAGKTVFFNETTGVLMVRATPEELQLVNAAVETLAAPQKPTATVSAPDRK